MVYSTKTRGWSKKLVKPRKMKKTLGNSGYYYVELFENKIGRKWLVHRLVAEAFIPNPLNKRQVNHKDGNKLNNYIANLEWASSRENVIHAFKSGLIDPTKYAISKLAKVIIKEIDNGATIIEIKTIMESLIHIKKGWFPGKSMKKHKPFNNDAPENGIQGLCNRM